MSGQHAAESIRRHCSRGSGAGHAEEITSGSWPQRCSASRPRLHKLQRAERPQLWQPREPEEHARAARTVSYTHLRAHETGAYL
eukprot:8910902-Pyramimonas_sp.AAC.1